MIKKIFGIVVMLGVALTTTAQNGFKINGKIEGVPDGELLLAVSNSHGGIDTLGHVITREGVFEFKGKVNELTAAFIMTVDQKGIIPLMLENCDYTVYYGPRGEQITGGDAQAIFNQFIDLEKSIQKEQKRVETEYRCAMQEQNSMKEQVLKQQFGKFVKKIKADEIALIKANADSYVTAYVIAASMQQATPNEITSRYALLGETAKQTPYGRMIGAMVQQMDRVAVGSTMPDFTVRNTEGSNITLADLNGKVKLIDFWASWCASCRQENVALIKLYRNYRSRGLEMLSISLDDKLDAWIKAIGEDGLNWKQGSDLLGQRSPLLQQFFIQKIPYTILLDKDNHIVAKDLSGKELQKKIEELLKE